MFPNDHGPVYAETLAGRFPVEPWSTYSNLIFLLVIIYWAWKTGLKGPWIIVLCLPIMFVGFIGGTAYHATRSSNVWLVMDYMPILFLSLIASIYFWNMLTSRMAWAFMIVASLFIVSRYLILRAEFLERGLRINAFYSMLAAAIILPALLVSMKRGWKGAGTLAAAVAAFMGAVLCRYYDGAAGRSFLPMGSHFLWHLLGGVSVFLVMQYLFGIVNVERADAAGKTAPPNV